MKTLLLLISLVASQHSFANVQEVYFAKNQTSQEGYISLDVMHNTDNVEKLTTLGLELAYDSDVLALVSIENKLANNAFPVQQKLGKINTSWASVFGNWAIGQNQKLYTIKLKFKENSQAINTIISVKANQISNNYKFTANEFLAYQ